MTRERSVLHLFIVWICLPFLLILLVFAQSVMGKYGSDAPVIWNWLIGQISAPIALTTTAYFSSASAKWRNGQFDIVRYRFALWFSLLQCILVAIFFLVEPLIEVGIFDVIEQASFLLTVAQGATVAAIGALVFEGR